MSISVRVLPKFPARVTGGAGLAVTKSGGAFSIANDWRQLAASTVLPAPEATFVPYFIGTTGEYGRISVPDMLNAIGVATAEQGALADTAVQPGDLAPVATTGAFFDLSGIPGAFPPAAHLHPMSEVTGLTAALASLADTIAEAGGGDMVRLTYDPDHKGFIGVEQGGTGATNVDAAREALQAQIVAPLTREMQIGQQVAGSDAAHLYLHGRAHGGDDDNEQGYAHIARLAGDYGVLQINNSGQIQLWSPAAVTVGDDVIVHAGNHADVIGPYYQQNLSTTTYFELGRWAGPGDRDISIDLNAHGGGDDTDYSSRIVRYGGANGTWDFIQYGTGAVNFYCDALNVGGDVVVHAGNHASVLGREQPSGYAGLDSDGRITAPLVSLRYKSAVQLPSGTDADDLLEPGEYDGYGPTLSHVPIVTTDWWYISVQTHSNGDTFVRQVWSRLSADNPDVYERKRVFGFWGPYRKIGADLGPTSSSVLTSTAALSKTNVFGSPDAKAEEFLALSGLGIMTGPNKNSIAGCVVQDGSNGPSFPSAIMGYSALRDAGNSAFAVFGRSDLYTAGVGTSELNTFNYAAAPEETFPPNRSLGTPDVVPVTLTLAAGGYYQSLIALEICREGETPQSYVSAIYTDPGAVTGTAIHIDANMGSGGPIEGAFLKNTHESTGHRNLVLQSVNPSPVPGSHVLAALNNSGVLTFGITATGLVEVAASNVSTVAGVAGAAGAIPGAPAGWEDIIVNGVQAKRPYWHSV